MSTTVTLSEKLTELEALIGNTWKDAVAMSATDPVAAEAKLLQVRAAVEAFCKRANAIRGAFDNMVDMRDAEAFGSDFAPKVTRIRAKVVGAGRKPAVKVDLLTII